MNIFKLFFCSLCVLSDLIPMEEPSLYMEGLLCNSQNKKNSNEQNKKNLFSKKNLFGALGTGTFTGLSLVGLQYKFPVFFEKYTQRLPNFTRGIIKNHF